jgi:hypothetical protein
LLKSIAVINKVLIFVKQSNLKTEIMRYLHYVLDQEGNQIESIYSTNDTPKFSLKCLAKIKNGQYKIWDRESK